MLYLIVKKHDLKRNDAKDTELDECLHSLMQQDLFANHWQSVVPAHYAILF